MLDSARKLKPTTSSDMGLTPALHATPPPDCTVSRVETQ
jgi:hypothetical protein